MKSVTTGELRTIIKALVKAAGNGDVQAAKVVLERVLGQPVAWDVEERLARLEAVAARNDDDMDEGDAE